MSDQHTKLLEAYPHLTQGDLGLLDNDVKTRLLELIESVDDAPPPKIETPTTAPPVKSLLRAHRVAEGGSIISKGRGVLLPNDPISLDDLGPGGIDAWRSLVARGKIALHSNVPNPGDAESDDTEIDPTSDE